MDPRPARPTRSPISWSPRRTERSSDVGATISVVDTAQLATAGVNDAGDLAKIVPGLTSTISQLGYPIFSLRSVNFNSSQLSASPALSTYIDGPTPLFLYDVGDAVRRRSCRGVERSAGHLLRAEFDRRLDQRDRGETTDTLGAGLKTDVNRFGNVMVEGHVNLPLSDTLRMRVAAMTSQFGRWQHPYHRHAPEW
ncbi:hypothetical protein [Nitrobacter sp.]|uniref:hypothetical protein n=1 Tax=Nitrobacter sp. TaxID=29420 RepID=UPI0029CAC69C|nr:hypothetical protein [Nitrobacter sp.]